MRGAEQVTYLSQFQKNIVTKGERKRDNLLSFTKEQNNCSTSSLRNIITVHTRNVISTMLQISIDNDARFTSFTRQNQKQCFMQLWFSTVNLWSNWNLLAYTQLQANFILDIIINFDKYDMSNFKVPSAVVRDSGFLVHV